MPKKVYLFPPILRKGQPTNCFVTREMGCYWLGTYHEYRPSGYSSLAKVRVSEEFYKTFVAEAKKNYARYKASKA